jgi:Ferritin-like
LCTTELSLWDASTDLFVPKAIDRQFSYEDGSWFDKSMIVVKDIDSAQAAIKTIVDQGEGNTTDPPRPKLPSGRVFEPIPPLAVKSHFQVFEDLHNGPKLDHHTFVKNPKTSDLKDETNKKVHSVRSCSSTPLVCVLT